MPRRATTKRTGPTGAGQLVALNEGFQSAFVAAMIFPIVGFFIALLTFGRPSGAEPESEPALAGASGAPAVLSELPAESA